jgi:hypothetical protein
MTNVAKKIVNTLAAIGLGLAVTNVNPVKAAQLTISGNSNIFGAGKTSAPAPGGGTGGQLPPCTILLLPQVKCLPSQTLVEMLIIRLFPKFLM